MKKRIGLLLVLFFVLSLLAPQKQIPFQAETTPLSDISSHEYDNHLLSNSEFFVLVSRFRSQNQDASYFLNNKGLVAFLLHGQTLEQPLTVQTVLNFFNTSLSYDSTKFHPDSTTKPSTCSLFEHVKSYLVFSSLPCDANASLHIKQIQKLFSSYTIPTPPHLTSTVDKNLSPLEETRQMLLYAIFQYQNQHGKLPITNTPYALPADLHIDQQTFYLVDVNALYPSYLQKPFTDSPVIINVAKPGELYFLKGPH